DSGDKLASVVSGGNARTFTYDLAGRMLTDSLGSRSFAWTADSRLKSLTASTGSETYTYSAFGTRAKVGTRTFLRAGAGVTAGVLDDGNAVYTPGVSEKRGSVTTFSHSGLKNTGAQTDAPGSGDPSVAATREYDAFGSPTAASGSWQGPFGYAGQFGYEDSAFADPLGGLHLLGHRYYDASLGRFLTRDPIGDGSNWYVYCVNDPVAFVDLEGLNHKGSKEWTAHTRIRMVVAPPGYESIGGRYWFGHSWVEIENPDETVDIYENNIGGNYHSSRMASDLLRDGVYYREMLVPRPRYRPSDGEFWYGGIVNNCISFTRVVWRENGGDAPLWQYIRPGLMGPAQLSAKLAQRDTPQGLFDDYDGWRRR
ncbi:MAG: RHS repeat-associated core domain-containing protein, partial [Fimbriimonadaceae bacterium]